MSNLRSERPLSPNLGEQERAFVFAVAMKYVKDEEAAADVTQEALLSAYRHRDQFRGDSRYSTWLYRVAATSALMYLRKRRRLARELLIPIHPTDDDATPVLQLADPAPTPEERVAASQVFTIIDKKLAGLGEKYRDIFWLRFREGFTEPEIAHRLGLKLTTVKTRAFRARAGLRNAIPESFHAA